MSSQFQSHIPRKTALWRRWLAGVFVLMAALFIAPSAAQAAWIRPSSSTSVFSSSCSKPP